MHRTKYISKKSTSRMSCLLIAFCCNLIKKLTSFFLRMQMTKRGHRTRLVSFRPNLIDSCPSWVASRKTTLHSSLISVKTANAHIIQITTYFNSSHIFLYSLIRGMVLCNINNIQIICLINAFKFCIITLTIIFSCKLWNKLLLYLY